MAAIKVDGACDPYYLKLGAEWRVGWGKVACAVDIAKKWSPLNAKSVTICNLTEQEDEDNHNIVFIARYYDTETEGEFKL